MRVTEEQYLHLWQKSLIENPVPQHLKSNNQLSNEQRESYDNIVTSERNLEIMRLYNEGKTYTQIQNILRLSRGCVSGVLDRYKRDGYLIDRENHLLKGNEFSSQELAASLFMDMTNLQLFYRKDPKTGLGIRIDVNLREAYVAHCLIKKKGLFCSAQYIISTYSEDYELVVKRPLDMIRNSVSTLRMKIKPYSLLIITQPGMGYKFARK